MAFEFHFREDCRTKDIVEEIQNSSNRKRCQEKSLHLIRRRSIERKKKMKRETLESSVCINVYMRKVGSGKKNLGRGKGEGIGGGGKCKRRRCKRW